VFDDAGFHRIKVTHANILTCGRSTLPHDRASLLPQRSSIAITLLAMLVALMENLERRMQNYGIFLYIFLLFFILHSSFFIEFRPQGGTLPPTSSVITFAPLNFRRKIVRPVSYYALFKRWLLLSQLPGCLNNLTSFATQVILGTLDGGLGSFPRVYGTSLSQTDSPDNHRSIRSLLGVGTVVYRPSPNRALPLLLVTGGYS